MLSYIGLYWGKKAFAKRLNVNAYIISVIRTVAVKMTHSPLPIIQIFSASEPEPFNEKYGSHIDL